MKKLFIAFFLTATLLVWTSAARAVSVNCIVCGNTALGPATLSYAVISGVDFLNEVAFHNIGFFGGVPGGSLDAIPNLTAPTDFVYLYQLVNLGPPLLDYTVAGSGISAPLLTGGGRLESTLFLDPVLGLVSPGPAGGTIGLSAGPMVDFLNGLNGNFGACLGSGARGVNCSDATANLFPGLAQATNFGEAPLAPLLDPAWTSSIMWFSSALGPGGGIGTTTDAAGNTFSGFAPAPVPVPPALVLFLTGIIGLFGLSKRNKAA